MHKASSYFRKGKHIRSRVVASLCKKLHEVIACVTVNAFVLKVNGHVPIT